MSNLINIGIPIDIERLLDTRALVQSTSGGGKSYLLRKLAESIGNKVQQIIIDPEGEFSTLREKFDFVLVGKGGDLPLSVKYAEMLAYKLMETNVSAIIDLYELKPYERIQFVKKFIESIMNLPKDLWHPCFIYVDESHIFCPEGSKSESANAIIDLCCRGRKRGYAAILATQRLSKLNKDAAAELLNKMIGFTSLDIDQKRSGDELGITSRNEILALRNLHTGEFHAFGPAICNVVTKFKVAPAITTHLRAGKRITKITPTPNAIKKILSKLNTIPEEAEKELITKQQMQDEITRLKRELSNIKPVSVDILNNEIAALKNELLEKLKQYQFIYDQMLLFKNHAYAFKQSVKEVSLLLERNIIKIDVPEFQPVYEMNPIITSLIKEQAKGRITRPAASPEIKSMVDELYNIKPNPVNNTDYIKPSSEIKSMLNKHTYDLKISKSQYAILSALAMYPDSKLTKSRIGIITNLSHTGGHFSNMISQLTINGLVEKSGDLLQITDKGLSYGPFEQLPIDPNQLIGYWREKLGKAPGAVLYYLFHHNPQYCSKENIAAGSGLIASGGHFSNTLSVLRKLELIDEANKQIRLNQEFFK